MIKRAVSFNVSYWRKKRNARWAPHCSQPSTAQRFTHSNWQHSKVFSPYRGLQIIHQIRLNVHPLCALVTLPWLYLTSLLEPSRWTTRSSQLTLLHSTFSAIVLKKQDEAQGVAEGQVRGCKRWCECTCVINRFCQVQWKQEGAAAEWWLAFHSPAVRHPSGTRRLDDHLLLCVGVWSSLGRLK